jgi:hypothetical protein
MEAVLNLVLEHGNRKHYNCNAGSLPQYVKAAGSVAC